MSFSRRKKAMEKREDQKRVPHPIIRVLNDWMGMNRRGYPTQSVKP